MGTRTLDWRLRLAAFAAAALCCLAAGSPAQADITSLCTVEGAADAIVNWGPNSGTYTFAAGGVGVNCVTTGTISGAPTASVDKVILISSGAFNNLACGTGIWADGTPSAPVVMPVAGDPRIALKLHDANWAYHIVFAAGQGALVWTTATTDTPSIPPPIRTAPTATGPVGGGSVNITPYNPITNPGQGSYFPGSPPNGVCTQGWNAYGWITLTLQA